MEHQASSVDRKLVGTPISNRLPRAPSFTVPCDTGEGFGPVWAFSMGSHLPLREMSLFQQGGASMHKLRMSCDDWRSEGQGQLMLQSCHKAHLQISGQSIMFTNVHLHTVQDYHDKVDGETRKLAGDQELASFNFEKGDFAISAATTGRRKAWGFCVVDLRKRRRRPMSRCQLRMPKDTKEAPLTVLAPLIWMMASSVVRMKYLHQRRDIGHHQVVGHNHDSVGHGSQPHQ